jgi:hypothetical protein
MSHVIEQLKRDLGEVVNMLDAKIQAFDNNTHNIATLMGTPYRDLLMTKKITILDTLNSIRLYEKTEEILTDNSHAC